MPSPFFFSLNSICHTSYYKHYTRIPYGIWCAWSFQYGRLFFRRGFCELGEQPDEQSGLFLGEGAHSAPHETVVKPQPCLQALASLWGYRHVDHPSVVAPALPC